MFNTRLRPSEKLKKKKSTYSLQQANLVSQGTEKFAE